MLKKFILLALLITGTFALTACKGDATQENLDAALAAISVDSEISSDLTLPTTGENDVEITWESSDTDVVSNDGTVTRPSNEDGDADVTLTATLTLGEKEVTKTFNVTVLALDPVDPVDALTDGYFTFSFYAEGYGSYTSYFNFYEDDPVLGAVFYYGGSNNAQNFAGTYTIEETDIEWAAYPDRESKVNDESENADDITTGTAPYTITFFDFEGNEMDQAGYDGEIIYNDMTDTRIAASGAGDTYYYHDTDGASSDYLTTYEGEVGIPYVTLLDPTDEAASLSINHNKTYADLIGEFIVEGTWSVEDGTSGELVFTLTPNESYDTGAEVVLNADSTEATYTAEGSTTATDLEVPVEEEPVDDRVVLFEWSVDATDRTLTFYTNSTWEFNYADSTFVEVGEFTYTGSVLTIIQSDGTEIVASLDDTTDELSLDYVSVAGSGAITATFTAATGVWTPALGDTGEYVVGPQVYFEWTTDNAEKTLTFYENGWYKFEHSGYSIVEYGTFTMSFGTITLTQSDGTEIVAVRDGTTSAQTLDYVAVVNDGITQTFTAEAAVWGAETDQGTYTPVYENEIVLFEWTTDNAEKTLTFYVTGVYKFEHSGYGIVEYGTFTMSFGTITLTQSDDTEIVAVRDVTTSAQTLDYVAVVNDGITQTFTAEAAVWGAETDQGTYTPTFDGQ